MIERKEEDIGEGSGLSTLQDLTLTLHDCCRGQTLKLLRQDSLQDRLPLLWHLLHRQCARRRSGTPLE